MENANLVVCTLVYKANLSLIGLSLGLSSQAARHGIDLALAAWNAIKDVNVEVLLDNIPDLVVLTLLQVSLQQLVRITRDAQDKLAGAEVEEGLVTSHVLLLCQARQNTQVVFIIALLVPTKPVMEMEKHGRILDVCWIEYNLYGRQVNHVLLLEKGNSLFKESLGLTFMIVVHQLQIHVDKQWVEDLGQFCSVTVQNCFYKSLEAAIVNFIQSRVSLLAVS